MELDKEMVNEIKKLRQQEEYDIEKLLLKYELDYIRNKEFMGGIRELYVSMIIKTSDQYTALEKLIIKKYAVKSILDDAACPVTSF